MFISENQIEELTVVLVLRARLHEPGCAGFCRVHGFNFGAVLFEQFGALFYNSRLFLDSVDFCFWNATCDRKIKIIQIRGGRMRRGRKNRSFFFFFFFFSVVIVFFNSGKTVSLSKNSSQSRLNK